MIRLIGVVGKIFVLDLASDMEGTISITGGISKDVDENICTLEELKYIETSFKTKRVSMSGGDFTKLLTAIETAPYSSLTGNAGKVLTVNDTEDGVEWTTMPSGGGGSGGGINVIEYDPAANEIGTPITGSDFNVFDNTATWNATTLTMGVGTVQTFEVMEGSIGAGIFTEFAACKLNSLPTNGEFTINASQCSDSFGFVALPVGVNLVDYLAKVHFAYGAAPRVYNPSAFSTDLYNALARVVTSTYATIPDFHQVNTYDVGEFPPTQTDYPVKAGTMVQIQAARMGQTEAAIYNMLVTNFGIETADKLKTLQALYTGFNNPLELDTPLTELYFFMTPYVDMAQGGNTQGTYTLNANSQITFSFNSLSCTTNTVPAEAVDGDFLHLLGNANLLNKSLTNGSFVQLYDNKTKLIVHSKPDNTTTSDITEGTNLFFTEDRVNQTVLTGLDTSTAIPALATDQLLAAIGKLQAQINNIAPPVWVSASSIGTTHSSFTNVQFAKINGLLWIRGYCSNTAIISAGVTLFLLTDPSYHLDIPPTTLLPIVLGEIKTFRSEGGSKLIELKNVPNNANKFSLSNSTIFTINEYSQIQPTAIGKLLN